MPKEKHKTTINNRYDYMYLLELSNFTTAGLEYWNITEAHGKEGKIALQILQMYLKKKLIKSLKKTR